MTRIVATVLAIALLTCLAYLAVTLLGGDPGAPDPDEANARPAATAAPPRPRTDPRRPGPLGANEARSPSGTSADAGPRPARPPSKPRLVLRVARITMRTEATAPPRRPIELPPPPIRPLETRRPYRCDLRSRGTRPIQVTCWAGSPWGLRRFPPEEVEPGRFRYAFRDPWGGRGPRILHVLLERTPYRYVDRWVPAGAAEAEFRVGPPGELTGRLVNAAGRGVPGWVQADGRKARTARTGRFVLRGVRAGRAVVYAGALDQAHAVRRSILPCPGGPHEIRLEPGVRVELDLDGLPPAPELDPEIWACAVPAKSTGSADYGVELSYHRTTRTGSLAFGPVPRGWSGVVAVHHPRFATRFVAVRDATPARRVVSMAPRAVLIGQVTDRETGRAVASGVTVTTSADATTLHDLAVARNRVRRPGARWHQPVPFLGQKLVDVDLSPPSGRGFEVHAEPALGRLAVRVEAEGYHPLVVSDVRTTGVRRLIFPLQRNRPRADGAIVLSLPPAPDGGWGDLAIEGPDAGRGQVDAGRGEVRFEGLAPGLYWFKLEGVSGVPPLQVDLAEGASLRLTFSQ